MSFRGIQKEAYENSKAKGFWEGQDPQRVEIQLLKLALIHSEVSEAVECCRKGLIFPYKDDAPGSNPEKPEGLPSELADVVIRCMDLAEALGIDLQGAIDEKMIFNTMRKRMHGGKLA